MQYLHICLLANKSYYFRFSTEGIFLFLPKHYLVGISPGKKSSLNRLSAKVSISCCS